MMKKYIYPIIVLILLVALAWVSYKYVGLSGNQPLSNNTTNIDNSISNNGDLTNNVIPSDWKEFSNEEIGVSFRYPAKFAYVDSKVIHETTRVPLDLNYANVLDVPIICSGLSSDKNKEAMNTNINMSACLLEMQFNKFKFVGTPGGAISLSEMEKIVLDNITAYSYGSGDAGFLSSSYLMVGKDSQILEISFGGCVSSDCGGNGTLNSPEAEERMILSTVKIIS